MLCKNCGENTDSSNKICPHCGQQTGFLTGLDGSNEIEHLKTVSRLIIPKNNQTEKYVPTVICKKCGKNNTADINFCVACGNDLQIPIEIEQPKPVLTAKAKKRIKQLSITVIAEAAIILILSCILVAIAVKTNIDKSANDKSTQTVTTASTRVEATTSSKLILSIKLSQTSLNLTKGESQTLTATVSPADASNKTFNWVSNKTTVATVDSNGFVTAKNDGFATIICTAKDGSEQKATCTINVGKAVTSIELKPASFELTIDQSKTLVPSILPTNAIIKTVNWKSSDETVATVDKSTGKVNAKSAGKATITCKTTDGSKKKATCTVTVIPKAPTSVKADRESSTSIKVSWAAVTGATGYDVYRYNSKTKAFVKIKDIPTNVSYTDAGLTKGVTYRYKVKAYNTVSGVKILSKFSVEVSA